MGWALDLSLCIGGTPPPRIMVSSKDLSLNYVQGQSLGVLFVRQQLLQRPEYIINSTSIEVVTLSTRHCRNPGAPSPLSSRKRYVFQLKQAGSSEEHL